MNDCHLLCVAMMFYLRMVPVIIVGLPTSSAPSHGMRLLSLCLFLSLSNKST